MRKYQKSRLEPENFPDLVNDILAHGNLYNEDDDVPSEPEAGDGQEEGGEEEAPEEEPEIPAETQSGQLISHDS